MHLASSICPVRRPERSRYEQPGGLVTRGALMIQGTGSDVGKSVIVAGLCRLLVQKGISVVPFKPQNMSNNAAACASGGEIGRAQALQARAAGIEATVDLNPVLLKPQTDRVAQVVVHGCVQSSLDAARFLSDRLALLDSVLESYTRLKKDYELVLVEGAGSTAETNLRRGDIANMGFAQAAGVPVCLLADIDRGGVIASVVGTKAVIEAADARLVRSFIINRFRGDIALFKEGVADIERHTSWPCRGVIPWLCAARILPQEDAIIPDSLAHGDVQSAKQLKIAVPMLSRIANSDDFDPLRMEPHVDCQIVPPGLPIPRDCDVIILPGSKSTIGDLHHLRAQGWDHDIIAHARAGGHVLGLCGGYQLLGRKIRDAYGVEGEPEVANGLGLLNVETDLLQEKTVRPLTGQHCPSGATVTGYEIHMGKTQGPDAHRPLIRTATAQDGAVSEAGNVAGCYVHGLFGNDAFRAAWLHSIRSGMVSKLAYEAAIEQSLDELAAALEAALDIQALLNDANWKSS